MRVVITLDFSDEEREQIVAYRRASRGELGLPKQATREMLRAFVTEALDNQWLAVADQLNLGRTALR